jgi:hypothetical protein
MYVSSYCCICVLILLCVSAFCMCPHTAIYVSTYCYTCVLILLFMCPHKMCRAQVASLGQAIRSVAHGFSGGMRCGCRIPIYVSAYRYMCPASAAACAADAAYRYMCPHTAIRLQVASLGQAIRSVAHDQLLQQQHAASAAHAAAEAARSGLLSLLYVCPHTYCYICVLIHTAIYAVCKIRSLVSAIYVSSYCYICVRIPLYMCPHTYCYNAVCKIQWLVSAVCVCRCSKLLRCVRP